jgi:aldehyde:ferredoxin oxidoreductase
MYYILRLKETDSGRTGKSKNYQYSLEREADDTPPERFVREPLARGPTKGSIVDIDKMVEEYYRLLDWRNG